MIQCTLENKVGGMIQKKEDLPSEYDFAFDHRNTILKYYQYLQFPFNIPILGEILL